VRREQPALPARHRHDGAAQAAPDREVVHQPPRARQPEPERAAGRDAVTQRGPDVGDARPAVADGHVEPAPAATLGRRELDLAAGRVLDRVERDLGDRGGDVLRLDAGEPALLGELARDAGSGRDVDIAGHPHRAPGLHR
jgi:hypothetical protein